MLRETATRAWPSSSRLHSSVSPRCKRRRGGYRRWISEQETGCKSPDVSREPLTSFFEKYRAPHLSSRARQRRPLFLAGPKCLGLYTIFLRIVIRLANLSKEIEIYDAQNSSPYPSPDGSFLGANLKSDRTHRPATKHRKSKVCLLRQHGLHGLQGREDVLTSREARKGRKGILL
jgi:hypothetical protein